jgi:hypothetical protein
MENRDIRKLIDEALQSRRMKTKAIQNDRRDCQLLS